MKNDNRGKGFLRICVVLCLTATDRALASRFGSSKTFLPKKLQDEPPAFFGSLIGMRGGDQEEVLTLDEKVQRAMNKLGISQPEEESSEECKDGVCPMPSPAAVAEDAESLANRIAEDMNVDASLAMAALGATSTVGADSRKYNEAMARTMIQQELDMINTIPEDAPEVSNQHQWQFGVLKANISFDPIDLFDVF